MYGRYCVDQLAKFLLGISLMLILVSGFTDWVLLNLMGSALLIFVYMRILSRNHYKCTLQNQKFLKSKKKITDSISGKVFMLKQLKDYRIFACPGCSQKVRIPKGKGKVTVTCPKCRAEFARKS